LKETAGMKAKRHARIPGFFSSLAEAQQAQRYRTLSGLKVKLTEYSTKEERFVCNDCSITSNFQPGTVWFVFAGNKKIRGNFMTGYLFL